MSSREQLSRSISIEQSLKTNITELEKEKYEAWKRVEKLLQERTELLNQIDRLTTLLQNSRAE